MPGLDHEVHHLTKQGDDARYGCNGESQRKDFYWARNVNRRLMPPLDVWIMVDDKMSRECRYDLSLSDSKCTDCPRRGSGEDYDKMIRSKGT